MEPKPKVKHFIQIFIENKPERVQPIKSRQGNIESLYFLDIMKPEINFNFVFTPVFKEIAMPAAQASSSFKIENAAFTKNTGVGMFLIYNVTRLLLTKIRAYNSIKYV